MADGIALLLRRAGFGPTSAEVEAASRMDRAAVVAALTAPPGPDLGGLSAPVPNLGPDPAPRSGPLTFAERANVDTVRGRQLRTMIQWWLDRLTVADHQAFEKLLFFWHGHWATSVKKVLRPQLMLTQHLTLRSSLDFSVMARNMVADPALIFWLDGELNTKVSPNENLGRELMELFTLGIGNYTERDVKEAGRALTGWRIDYREARAHATASFHDAGMKTILGVTKPFDALSLVELLLDQQACPRFIASRLWFRFASSESPIPAGTQAKMVAAFPDSMAMLRVLLQDDAFQASSGKLVKQPVEWLVGALRQLGLRPAALPDDTLERVINGLERMGQLPFAPRSVGGWPAGAAWLTAGAAQARLTVAVALASSASVGSTTPESLAHRLVIDRWTDRTHAALTSVKNPRQRLMIALVSPEYLVT
jgi:uncharacterized protein (DUF1800 family)